jgi:hypothetical protein
MLKSLGGIRPVGPRADRLNVSRFPGEVRWLIPISDTKDIFVTQIDNKFIRGWMNNATNKDMLLAKAIGGFELFERLASDFPTIEAKLAEPR